MKNKVLFKMNKILNGRVIKFVITGGIYSIKFEKVRI